jgi:hypothetical protein
MVDTLTGVHPLDRTWHIMREPAVMSCAEFMALRAVSSAPMAMLARPRESCRALIGGRWHAVERQYQFGSPVYFANPITIRLKAAEL